MGELSREIARKLVWINDKQIARWSGITGEEFRNATREVIGEIINIEELLDSRGINLGIIHNEGTLFRFAYWGTLFCSHTEELTCGEKLKHIEAWVCTELEDANEGQEVYTPREVNEVALTEEQVGLIIKLKYLRELTKEPTSREENKKAYRELEELLYKTGYAREVSVELERYA